MPWVRIDDHFDEHPKHATAGPLGWALWLAGLAYSNRNLTDGFIPWTVAQGLVTWQYLEAPDEDGPEQGRRKLMTIAVTCGMKGDDVKADRIIELLLRAGLWEEIDGGYYIHDYPDYQFTKAEIEAKREAGQAGGKAAAQARATAGATAGTKAAPLAKPKPKPTPAPIPTPPSPPPLPDQDADFARLQAQYERHFGLALTPTRAQKLLDLAEDFGSKAVADAMEEAARHKKTDPRYMEAILERWRAEGGPRKGVKVEKAGRNTEQDLAAWAVRNYKLLGYASEDDARRAIGSGRG